MKTYKLMVKHAKSTNDFVDLKSPYSGKTVAKLEKADLNTIKQALKNADEYFHKIMKHMPAHKRAEILYKVADMVAKNSEELSLTIAQEGGKPLTDARAEVARAITTVKMSGDEALQLNGEQLTMDRSPKGENHLAFTIRQAIGPVLAISAFNHPVNLICHQLSTAFAAGNTVVIKPASQTPVSCMKMVQYFYDAGVDEGVISPVLASGSLINQIIDDPRIKFVNFIGGENVGWELRKKLAPGARIVLEHGGTGTAIVTASADLKTSIPNLVKAGFYHAGQVCVSTQNIYIHESIYDLCTKQLQKAVQLLHTGDPEKASTDVGPLINPKEIDRMDDWTKEAVSKGARLVIGGKRLKNHCFSPTILADTTPAMSVVKKEIFGPIITLQKYKTLAKLIPTLNKSDYAFQTAIYTQDIDNALNTAQQIECKAFMINQSTAFRVDWMPFGGSKHAGLGLGGTRNALYDMTEQKLIVIKTK